MPTSMYFFRVFFLDSDKPVSGSKTNYSEGFYIDKKQFTIGSGPEADIKVTGPEVDALHLSVKIEGTKLFIKNLSQGNTQLSTYKVPFDKTEPYTPGEAIRVGASKQVIFVELFRKFVDPISEREAIIREAWERAEEAEKSVEEHKNALVLLKKQASQLKLEVESEAQSILTSAQKKAKEIELQASKAKDQLIQSTLQERETALQQVQKDLEQKMQELHVAAEANARKLLEQAREKNKVHKQEAEKEIEALQLSAQKQVEITIEVAKKKALELSEESRLQIEASTHKKAAIEKDISLAQQNQKQTRDRLTVLKSELDGLEQTKKQVQREFELEKERLRLAGNSLQEQLVVKESEMRAMKAKVEDFTTHLSRMKIEMENCKAAAHTALQAKENAVAETQIINQQIQSLSEEKHQMESENAGIAKRLEQMRFEESQERDNQRERLRQEYEGQKEFELQWFSQQRLIEQESVQKEKVLQEKMEQDGLKQQSQKIVDKILPLLSIELSSKLSSQQAATLLPQLETAIAPIVERSVTEEFEFRRKHRIEIQPTNLDRLVADFRNSQRKHYGMVTVSVVLVLMAIFISWSKAVGLQVAYLSFSPSPSTPPATATEEPLPQQAPFQSPRLPASR